MISKAEELNFLAQSIGLLSQDVSGKYNKIVLTFKEGFDGKTAPYNESRN